MPFSLMESCGRGLTSKVGKSCLDLLRMFGWQFVEELLNVTVNIYFEFEM